MGYSIAKALISGVLVLLVSEAAKHNPRFGALIASLPLVSVLAMLWLWQGTGDRERIAVHASATFWLVLPSLPLFLLLPTLLRHGVGFYPAMGVSCLVTVLLYLVGVWLFHRLGIAL